MDGVPLDPGRWIYMSRPHRLVTMAGLMRTATWWALFKRIAVRDWVVFAEKFGLPYVTGMYSDGMNEDERAALRAAVAAIGTDGHAVIPKDAEIQIHETRRGGSEDSIHGALVSLCNSEISKLISGATLTSGEGTSTGSYALARVHQERAFDLIVGDAERVADTFTTQLAAPFLAYNGIVARPPRLKIHVVRATEPETRMKLLSAAANELGLQLDETQVRSEFQIKAPVGTPIEGTKVPQPTQEAAPDAR
jgi:phage gp29-like protein